MMGVKFIWQDNHLEMLKKLVVDNPKDENLLLLLQKGDEVLDYKDALKTSKCKKSCRRWRKSQL